MAEYERPLPVPHLDNKEFWEGCKKHELLVQRCKDCGIYRFPPRPMCHECNSFDVEWVKASGKGKIYTWTVLSNLPRVDIADLRPRLAIEKWRIPRSFRDEAPIGLVIVELDDAGSVHIVSNMVDCNVDEISMEMPVEVVFEDVTDEITLPIFKRVSV